MVPPTGKLRVVGDDLQSIYNWRGSDVTRILEFSKDFAPADVFRLSMNYRSRPEIVRVANSVAEDIILKDPIKVMKPGRSESGCDEVHWISTTDELQQTGTIVEIVRRFKNKGVPYAKMAILLRSVLKAGQPIYQALQAADIPVECPMLSRGGAFINQFLLPVLQWLRTEQKPPKNKQDEDAQEAYALAVWGSVAPWLSIDHAEGIFWSGLNRWYDFIRQGKSSAYNVRSSLYDFLDECGIRIGSSDTSLMVGIGIASQIIRSVEEIHRRRIEGHKRRTAVGVISELYYALIRNQEDFGESLPVNQQAEGVILTTVHQAKGLEWPVVILPMLIRRRFPLSSQPAKSSFPQEIAGRYGTSIDDERRLFYVAVTRARERLFLLDTAESNPDARSQFLKDLQRTANIAPWGLRRPSDSSWLIAGDDLSDDSQIPLRVGLSDLLLYLECPYQFGLRRVTGLQPSVGDELGFGKGLHELIQRRAESDHSWSKHELTTQVDTHVHLPLTSDQSEQQAKAAIAERVTELEKLGAFEGNLQQELQVEVFLGDGVVTGVIDSVYTHQDGSLVVRDWKANIHPEFILRYTHQLQFYVHALRTQNKIVSAAELVDVGASTKAGKLVTTSVDISEVAVSALITDCELALQAIRAGEFKPKPSTFVCGSCDMRRICAEREGSTNA
jgi:DNA helicase-2/ATP-dependent DNA helicase PcrA